MIAQPFAAKLKDLFRRPQALPDIVFLGDSITKWWARYDPAMFRGRLINKGVGGQNTDGLLARFEVDVVQLKPGAVHIMGGTNDLWHTLSPAASARALANIERMVDLAQGAGIRPIVASVPPINPEIEPSGRAWAKMIAPLNVELDRLAGLRGLTFVDYASRLGPDGDMDRIFSDDGVHPNRAGYAMMSRVWRASNEAS